MKKIRILLADDHKILRIGLKTLLDAQADMSVVGEASDGAEAAALAAELSPDVTVMDLVMSGTDGIEGIRLIRERNPNARVIILTSYSTAVDLKRALDAGAVGAQLKGSSTEGLLKAVRAVMRGERAVDPEVEKLVRREEATPQLTERQTAILSSVVEGYTTDVIAKIHGISTSAVKQHLAAICDKIGASTRAEAAAIAVRRHLVDTVLLDSIARRNGKV